MHIELIDLLRCPREHEETWLVAALSAVQDRFVLKAKLGCPVCGASYSITNGTADLRTDGGDRPSAHIEVEDEEAVRIAGLLNLTTQNSVVVLEAHNAMHAHRVSEMTVCRVIALNPSGAVDDSETVATVLCDARIPLASRSIAGAACESENVIQDAARVLRDAGRALLPVDSTIPSGLTEIARDDRNILAESIGNFVTLRR
jgi:hypothetical protein